MLQQCLSRLLQYDYLLVCALYFRLACANTELFVCGSHAVTGSLRQLGIDESKICATLSGHTEDLSPARCRVLIFLYLYSNI